jgi:hypothetical protein
MEKEIIKVAKNAIKESVIKSLTSYNCPFNDYVIQCISKHEYEFKDLINGEITTLLNSNDFKVAIKEALHNKLARTLVHKVGGEYEKMVNRLKQDPTTRAKITLAIDTVVNECIENK